MLLFFLKNQFVVHLILERSLNLASHKNRNQLCPPSSGISSLGLHSYAGKASYVGNTESDGSSERLRPSNKPSNVAIVRPRPSQRNPSISSTTVETGEALPPVKRPRVRKWYNLYGVIDTEKLGNLFGSSKCKSAFKEEINVAYHVIIT